MAARKVQGLLSAGATVRLISPAVTPELQELADSGKLSVVPRPYQDGDLAGVLLVIAATDDAAVNESVWREAQRQGCLINVADDPAHSNFTLPAVLQRGELTIAVSTGGASPALARRLREQLEILIGPEHGLLVEVLGELRTELLADFGTGDARLEAALRVIDSDILSVLRAEGKEAALSYGREQMHASER